MKVRLCLRGETVKLRPGRREAHGIGMIYQELTTMPSLTVAENVFLGRQYTNRLGLVDWGRMRRTPESLFTGLEST